MIHALYIFHLRFVLTAYLLLSGSVFVLSIRAQSPITALALTPDHEQYLTGSQSGIVCYDLSIHRQLSVIKTELEQVHDLVFNRDGTRLLAVGGTPAEHGRAEEFTWPAGKCVRTHQVADDLLYSAAWLDDRNEFLVGSADGQCTIVSDSAAKAKRVYSGHSQSVLTVAALQSQNLLASAGVDQTIQLWELNSAQRTRALSNHTASVTHLALRPSQQDVSVQLASSGEDRTVRIWQPLIGRMVRFVRLESVPRKIAWSVDGDQLMAACDDGRIHWIDSESMSVLHSHASHIRPIFELQVTVNGVLVAGEGGTEFVSRAPSTASR